MTDDFSRRPTAPSRTAVRDPRATIQPTGERAPAPPDTPNETPDSKQRASSRTAMPTNLDLLEAFNGGFSRLAGELGDVKRELRDQDERLKVVEKAKRSYSPVPALGAVSLTSPPLASPGNPGDVLVPVSARTTSMTGDPVIDAQRLKALEADQTEDSLRYRSLAAETAEQNRRLAMLESAIKAQPVAAEKAAEKVAEKAAEQTTAIERLLKDKTFTAFLYGIAALVIGLTAQTLAARALSKGDTEKTAEVVAEKAAKEVARDTKPTVVIVREHDANDPTTKDAAP